jgi:signal transduction histidine kinase/streptogramin lyase
MARTAIDFSRPILLWALAAALTCPAHGAGAGTADAPASEPDGPSRWWPNPWNARDEISRQSGAVMAVLPEADAGDTEPEFGAETGWVQLRPPLPGGTFTLSLWLRCTGGNRASLIGQESGFRKWTIRQQADQGAETYLLVSGEVDEAERAEPFTLTAGSWHHLVVTGRPDGTTVVWVDEVRVVDGKARHDWPAEASWLCLGNEEKGDRPWPGTIRDVRVYDRILTDAEVQSLHRRGLPPRAPLDASLPRAAPLADRPHRTVTNTLTSPIDVVHRRYTAEDGLPANSVQCVLQSRSGHLWVGTEFGLARFDGQQFRVFDEANTPALADIGSDISSLAEAPDGTLWAGVYGGLLRVRGAEFTAFTHGLPERFVLRAMPDTDGSVWVAGFGLDPAYRGPCRLRRYDPVTQTSRAEALIPGQVRHILPGRAGVWVAAEEPDAIFLWREGRETPTRVASILPRAPWIRIADRFAEFPEATLRIGSRVDDTARWVEFRPESGLPGIAYQIRTGDFPVWVSRSAVPPGAPTWIGSPAGLDRIDATGTRTPQIPDPHRLPGVECLVANREGGVWYGTDEDGLHLVRERTVTLFTKADGLPSDDVRSVSVDGHGMIWAATPNGLARQNGARWETAVTARGRGVLVGPAGLPLLATPEHGDTALWAVQRDGGAKPVLPTLGWSFPNSLHLARNGTVWVACERGLTRIGPSILGLTPHSGDPLPPPDAQNPDWIRFAVGRELPASIPIGVVEAPDGSIWSGTKGAGLLHLHSNRVEVLTTQDGLPSDTCAAVLAEADGSVWIVTDAGLVRRRDGRFAVLAAAHGLPDKALGDLITDDQGDYWLTGQRGIHRLGRAEVEAVLAGAQPRLTSLTLGLADGLRTPECSLAVYPTIAKAPDGRLWVATRGGLAVVDPRQIALRRQPLEASIETVLADRTPIDLRPARNYGPDAVHGVTLPPGSGRRLDIQFTAVSLNDAHRLQFRHRLDGYDRGWSPPSDRRFAFYTNLRPGTYRFRVQAARTDGDWPASETVLAFRIRAFFWETTTFGVLVTLAGLALVGLIHRRRLLGLRRIEQLKRQEALASERARIAADLHDDLGAALTQISMLGELAKAKAPSDSPARAPLDRALGVAREVTARMGDLVWSTDPTADSLDNLVAHLREQVARQFESADRPCHLHFPASAPARQLSPTFRRNVLLVVKEAVHNALKHSEAGQTEVALRVDADTLSVRVTDNGPGFDLGARAHAGHGLTNMRRRTEDLGGRFDLASAPGQGTRITLLVPLPPAQTPR